MRRRIARTFWISIGIFVLCSLYFTGNSDAATPRISAGFVHTVALKADGTVWTWGGNAYGQLGDGSNIARNTPTRVPGGGYNWVAIAAGGNHTAALKSDGTLWAWGWNLYGQLGDGSNIDRNTPVEVSGGGNTWVAIAAEGAHTIALKSDGTLWAWGWNGHGQLGDGSNTDRNTPVQVSGGGSTWTAIAAGEAHTVALKSDGTLWAWGWNLYGQVGDDSNNDSNTPVQVSGGGNTWSAIAAGSFHTVAMKSDGTLWTWGRDDFGQLGDNSNTDKSAPVEVFGGGSTWVAITAGIYHTVALKSDGTLWAWGYNVDGQLGDGSNTNTSAPVQVPGGGSTWVAIAAGGLHTAGLKSGGTLWTWGRNDDGQLGDGATTNRNTPAQILEGRNPWRTIAAGYGHTVALKSDGTLWGSGSNSYGQLGDGSNTGRDTLIEVFGGGNTWVAIAAGGDHTVALKSDGTLWTWGANYYGQLGDGTFTGRNTPAQVFGGGNTWTAIAAGLAHTSALKSDGTLWTWGYNVDGQLGDGTNTYRNTPVQVFGGGNTWVAIAARKNHTVALKSDGTLWAWGGNGIGQLGDGSLTDRNTPVQVFGGGNTWVAIAAGGTHTVGLKSNGTLWAWGRGNEGQLGDGSFNYKNTPVQVFGGGSTWSSIAAGGLHTVALKSDGTLWTWGMNFYSQLGIGPGYNINKPVQVSGGGNTWVAIAAGGNHTVGLKSNGTLWAWGANNGGQLGEPTYYTLRSVPTRVGPMKGIVNFDGDRSTDISFYRSNTGAWWITPSSGAPAYGYGWGGPGFKPVPGDYDGDGKTDIAIYDTTGGAWWIIPSSGIGPEGQVGGYGVGWGGSAFKPVPGDYDGDGKTDVAIYDTTAGAWWIIPSSGAPAYGVGWGGSAFTPVPGDYDGDGKTDIAIYHNASGGWWIIPSSGAPSYGIEWGGNASDIPVPGDYNGDGKADFAIYRVSTGDWFILPTSDYYPFGLRWGGSGFKPIPGDYDGDKKMDFAIYDTASGAWWIVPSSSYVAYGVGWGGDASDVPLTINPD